MIARLWHGVTPIEKADEYVEFLNRTGMPDYQQTPGNRGAYMLRSIQGDQAHFLLLSLWDSYDAIRNFAGDEIEKAHYYAEDPQFLIALEPTVTHYEVLAAPASL